MVREHLPPVREKPGEVILIDRDQVVGQGRVLRQQRAVQVGTDRMVQATPLVTRDAVVAVAVQHAHVHHVLQGQQLGGVLVNDRHVVAVDEDFSRMATDLPGSADHDIHLG